MDREELTAHEEIRRTLAQYNQAGDGDAAELYAAAFTPDALFEAPAFRHSGRDAILAWKRSHKVFGSATFRQHHVSSTLIELESMSVAHVRSNWLAITNIGQDHCGRYLDRFRKTGDRWLIEHRRVTILWRAENSSLGPEHLSPGDEPYVPARSSA